MPPEHVVASSGGAASTATRAAPTARSIQEHVASPTSVRRRLLISSSSLYLPNYRFVAVASTPALPCPERRSRPRHTCPGERVRQCASHCAEAQARSRQYGQRVVKVRLRSRLRFG